MLSASVNKTFPSFLPVPQLCGLALLGIGIWVKVDPKVGKVQDLAELQSDTRYIHISSYVLIGVGGFVVMVGVFGCCGGLTSNRCLLGLVSDIDNDDDKEDDFNDEYRAVL